LDFSYPIINSTFPGKNQTFSDPSEIQKIEISFSKEMSIESLINAFSLKHLVFSPFTEEKVSGNFFWSSGGSSIFTLTFVPGTPLIYGEYKIEVLSSAEDINGNNLQETETIIFSIGNDHIPPAFISSQPANNSTNLITNQIITLHFSEPVKTENINTCISFNPAMDYFIKPISNNDYLEIHPLKPYQNGLYSVTISEVPDLWGNKMLEPTVLKYKFGNDFTPPTFQRMCTNSFNGPLITNTLNLLDKFTPLLFFFSETVDFDVNASPITFTPSATGIWNVISNKVTFTPSEPFEIDKTYIVTLNNDISDLSGNKSSLYFYYSFMVTSPLSYYVNITNIVHSNSTWKLGILNVVTNITNTNNTMIINFSFNSSIMPASVLENVQLSYIAGPGSLEHYLSKIEYLSNVVKNDTVRLTIKKLGFYNTYKILFTGGKNKISDIYTNWIKQDIEVYFRVAP
jgi:hypothetical protein